MYQTALSSRRVEAMRPVPSMAGDDVAAEAAVCGHGPLQVHPAARGKAAQRGAAQRLMHNVGGKGVAAQGSGGEADSVDCHAVTDLEIGEHSIRPDGQYRGVGAPPDLPNDADLFNNSCEHVPRPRFREENPAPAG